MVLSPLPGGVLREEAEGPGTCAAAPARSLDFREGAGAGGRLWGHGTGPRGPGVSRGCESPRALGRRTVGELQPVVAPELL